MKTAIEQMLADGFSVGSLDFSGKIQRIDRNGKRNAWYIAFSNDGWEVVLYGDWKTGEQYKFQGGRKCTPDERRQIAEKIKKAQALANEEKKTRQEETASEAEVVWSRGSEVVESDYLKRKKITQLHGARTRLGINGRELLIPVRDIDGKLWGIETVFPEGKKLFMSGQRVGGCFHLIGELSEDVLVCEGFATGASLHMATGKAVAVAFYASNLASVCEELRKKEVAITVAGDDDRWTDENAGKKAAVDAAKKCMGAVKFPVFPDLSSKPTDFNDLHVLCGLEEVKRQLGEVKAEKHFVRALGYDGTHFYYTSSSNRRILAFTAQGHTALNFQSLMPNPYWEAAYPGKTGISWSEAAAGLMEKCRHEGFFSLANVRGIGAWNEEGRAVVNLGDRIWSDGQEFPIFEFKSRNAYQTGRPVRGPGNPLSVKDCEVISAISNLLKWKRKESRIFFSGFLAISRLSGLLPWRPHLWVTGGAGSGKTTVMEQVIRPVIGQYAISALGNTTEAGIRQSMGPDARAVVFDEIETLDERSDRRIKGILDLARQSSSDSDATILKGTVSGAAMNFKVRSSFIFSSIRVNLTNEADRSRFTLLELDRGGDREQWRKLEILMARLKPEFCDRLFARSLLLWEKTVQNQRVFADLLAAKHGPRFAQQYGTLMAGFHSLLSDEVVETEVAEAMLDQLNFDEDLEHHDEKDENEALSHLFSKRVTIDTPTGRSDRSIGELVMEENDGALSRFGLRVKKEGETLFILVANSHSELNALYRDTRWTAGWAKSLARIPGAVRSERTRFGPDLKRCVKIPVTV